MVVEENVAIHRKPAGDGSTLATTSKLSLLSGQDERLSG